MSIKKIISGGQTGADQAGLIVGVALGLETGGWAPKGWATENGAAEWLREFGLREYPISGYPARTEANVRDADGTVMFGDRDSLGTICTSRAIKTHRKPNVHFSIPHNHIDRVRYMREWLEKNNVTILNVAGNRESKNPGIHQAVVEFLLEVLS